MVTNEKLENAWQEFEYLLDVLWASNGAYAEAHEWSIKENFSSRGKIWKKKQKQKQHVCT